MFLVVFSQGYVATAAYTATKTIDGVAQKSDTLGMNYHAGPPAKWSATHAQLREMRLVPTGSPQLKDQEGELRAGGMKIRAGPLKDSPAPRRTAS